MPARCHVIPKIYRDSVTLMQLASRLAKVDGIEHAAAQMATLANMAQVQENGFDTCSVKAGPNDIIVSLKGSETAIDQAIALCQDFLNGQSGRNDETAALKIAPRSISMALRDNTFGLALISVPGDYAAAEALKAIDNGLDAMIFSDNVSLADEVLLKQRAWKAGRLVMGPDCGTAIIDGIPLAFANAVRSGPIGVIGASGTGLQQVTCLIDQMGSGISQAIGTGGRDLSHEVGGLSMLTGLKHLATDPDTDIIVLVSKPPAREIAKIILEAARNSGKPVVVNFLGQTDTAFAGSKLHFAATLEEAARKAVILAGGIPPAPRRETISAPRFASSQRYLRGLFTGGTFCYEACLILRNMIALNTNTPVRGTTELDDPMHSSGHCLVDLGDDVFTHGRPHPMIDPSLRNERIVKEAKDPGTAVILLDVVLGHGAHPDPVSTLKPAIETAQQIAKEHGRQLAFAAHICGTKSDPQHFENQKEALQKLNVLLAESNAQAVHLAARLMGIDGGAA